MDPSRPADAAHPTRLSPSLEALIAQKRRFIMPMLLVSLGVFFGVTLLAGVARPFMAVKLVGSLNVGYLLIACIYLMCWAVAILYYVVATNSIDPLVAAVLAERDLGSGAAR